MGPGVSQMGFDSVRLNLIRIMSDICSEVQGSHSYNFISFTEVFLPSAHSKVVN